MRAPKPDNRVTFTHGCGTFKTQPANVHKVRAALDAIKPAKVRIEKARTSYPEFTPGMTTQEYIYHFHQLNDVHHWAKMAYAHVNRVAPMLDPTIPEVHEEPDPDYVEPEQVRKPRAKRQTYSLADIRNGTGWPDGARFQLVAS